MISLSFQLLARRSLPFRDTMRPPLPSSSRGATASLRVARSSAARAPPALAAWRALKADG